MSPSDLSMMIIQIMLVSFRSITIAVQSGEKKRHKGEETKTIKVGAEDSKEVLGTGGFTVSRDNKSVKMRDGDGKDINSTFSIEDPQIMPDFLVMERD